MILKKLNRFLIVFFIGFHAYAFSEPITLLRVFEPQRSQMHEEKSDYATRQLKRHVVKAGTVAGIFVMMYITYNASKYFKELDRKIYNVDQRVSGVEKVVDASGLEKNATDVEKVASVVVPKVSPESGSYNPITFVASGLKSGVVGTKNFVTDVGKCFIETFPTFITGMIFSTLWQQMCNRIIESSKQETLSWYIENHTKLWPLFHDLTLGCIPFDIHSELLSLQQVHDKCTSQMNAYVADLSALNLENDEGFMDDAYVHYASSNVKKNHLKKASELAQLQNYAAPNIAKRKRAIDQGLHGAALFQDAEIGKQNIVDLCTMLTTQIQKVLAFTTMRIDARRSALSKATIERGEKKIAHIIVASNNYLNQMEKLLNMDYEQLEGMSVANQGMFTCTYEFERLFKEHIVILHRYCALIG